MTLVLVVDEFEHTRRVQGDGGTVDGLTVRVVAHAHDLRVFGVVDVQREVIARHNPVQCRRDELTQRNLGGCNLTGELFHSLVFEGAGERADFRFEALRVLKDLEGLFIVNGHHLDDVWEGAVAPFVDVVRFRTDDGVTVFATVDGVGVVVRKEPGESVKVHLSGFVEEVEAALARALVDVLEEQVRDFGRIGRVGDVRVVYRITSVGTFRVVEIEDVKFGLYRVVFPQMFVLSLQVNL